MTTTADAHERDEQRSRESNANTLLKSATDLASDAGARLSGAAQSAGREAKTAASQLSAEAQRNVKGLLNDQIASGADLAGHVAGAVRVAAGNLGPNAPQLAGFVGTAADAIEDLSGTMRDSTVEDLFHAASQFTRRQPAAVFGMAAVAGFFLFRVLKVDGSDRRGQGGIGQGGGGFGGSGQGGGYPGQPGGSRYGA